MTVGSLFAGIGGFDLGLERAGMTVKWQVEIDPFCRRVLAKHWPHVRRYEDVREIHAAGVCGHPEVCDRCVEPVDVLCGGFPCQDISSAGAKVGIEGSRSGLWSEYYRLIRELRPRYVVVENVSALLARGAGRVLGDLAAGGYDAEWDCLPASAFGAPHRRDRVWIVGYAYGNSQSVRAFHDETSRLPSLGHTASSSSSTDTAPSSPRRAVGESTWWAAEPGLDRVADGLPGSMDRLRGLGNAVVPQIPEWIGRQILAYEACA